jgi:glycosyltransferase involved in cell wall biosynthesis
VSAQTPLISVVLASVNGLPYTANCVQALLRQEGDVPVEVIVVDRCGEEVRTALRERFPQERVHIVEAAEGDSIPRLRAIGVAQASGRLVAITEDHCIVPPNWCADIARAHRDGHPVVGGPVENGSTERTVDWAVFFCEYARFMPPCAAGVVPEVPGSNCAYDRAVLDRLGDGQGQEVWESFLHGRLREMGVEFYCDPALAVSHVKRFGYWYFMGQRYHYSRSFAGMRMAGRPWMRRVAYACAAIVLLPWLLLGRMTATVARKRRHGWRFVRALPVILTFLLSWGWGEAVGSLLGAGASLEKVE